MKKPNDHAEPTKVERWIFFIYFFLKIQIIQSSLVAMILIMFNPIFNVYYDPYRFFGYGFSSNKVIMSCHMTLARFLCNWIIYIVAVVVQLWVTTCLFYKPNQLSPAIYLSHKTIYVSISPITTCKYGNEQFQILSLSYLS